MALTLEQIAGVAAAKVGRNDEYAETVALGFARIRHQYVYDSFNWQVTQTANVIPITAPLPGGAVTIPDIDRIISIRYFRSDPHESKFLDPVTTEFLYETGFDTTATFGEPNFYVEIYDQSTQQRVVVLYPTPQVEEIGDGVNIAVLGKKPFDPHATSAQIPYVDHCLIAFVTADLLETFKQVGKAKEKLAEAEAMLAAVQAKDTPPVTRPRSSKRSRTRSANSS